MKVLLLILSIFSIEFCGAQKVRPVSLEIGGQFNFRTEGLGMNDAGLGFEARALFPAAKRLKLVAETGVNAFIGNKLLIYPGEGRQNETAMDWKFQAGPQVNFSRKIAASFTYGLNHYSYAMPGYDNAGGYTARILGYSGKRNRLVTSLFLSRIHSQTAPIRFMGFNLAYRLF